MDEQADEVMAAMSVCASVHLRTGDTVRTGAWQRGMLARRALLDSEEEQDAVGREQQVCQQRVRQLHVRVARVPLRTEEQCDWHARRDESLAVATRQFGSRRRSGMT